MFARTTHWTALLCFVLAVIAAREARCQVSRGYFTDVRKLPPPVDTGSIEAAPAISADGLTLYFTSNRSGTRGPFGLYQATRPTIDEPFGEVVGLGPEVNSSAWDGKPIISPDGLTLYFNSNRPEGHGGFDLYQATRPTVDDAFGNVMNLGAINTSFDDSTGHVAPDGLTLYFSSDRPEGSGSFDIYMATRDSPTEPFGNVTNLGTGVNTATSEFSPSISADGLSIFFSDHFHGPFRRDNEGLADIYVAIRESIDEPFGDAVNLNEFSLGSELLFGSVNGSGADKSPSISHDWPAPGSQLYFYRGRGADDIWQATWVPAPLLGDYDGSGDVDQADLDLVLLNWGARVHPRMLPDAWSGVPASGRFVDQQELDNVLLEWGQTANVGAIPEPATSVLLLLGLTAVAAIAASRKWRPT